MKKQTILKIVGVFAIIISFMAWDIYENKEKETDRIARAEKIHTTSDILKDADFNVEQTALAIRPVPSEPYKIEVENEEQRKLIIEELANLKLQESTEFFPYTDGTQILLKLNKEYTIYLFEQKKNIYFVTSEPNISYDIVDGDDFFKLLDEVN